MARIGALVPYVTSLAIVGAIFVGCASIPREAPQLSAELGNRISALESANLTLLSRYFDLKRAEVDRFIDEVWVPEYAEEVFESPQVADAWNTIVSETDTSERLKFIVWIGPKIQTSINEKRAELVAPFDLIEKRVAAHLRSAYTEARAINNTLTSFLFSAANVAENRARYLDMVEVTDEQIGYVIHDIDNVVADLLAIGRDAANTVSQIEDAERQFVDKLSIIGSSIGIKE